MSINTIAKELYTKSKACTTVDAAGETLTCSENGKASCLPTLAVSPFDAKWNQESKRYIIPSSSLPRIKA